MTYKEAELDGAHRDCLLQAVAICKHSIMDLLINTEQQWICSTCRFNPDHQAMLSAQPSCACGISLEATVGIYSAMRMDELASTGYGGKMLTQMEKTSNTAVNYSDLAEHMLNPHHGHYNELIRPDHWCQGSEGACDCIKVEPPRLWLRPVRGALMTKWKRLLKMTRRTCMQEPLLSRAISTNS
jgi:hypothetical protein